MTIIAVNDSYETNINTTLNGSSVLANDTNADASSAVLLVSDAAHGTLDLASDGTFTYEPDTGFVGTDTFTYKVWDLGANMLANYQDLTAWTLQHVTVVESGTDPWGEPLYLCTEDPWGFPELMWQVSDGVIPDVGSDLYFGILCKEGGSSRFELDMGYEDGAAVTGFGGNGTQVIEWSGGIPTKVGSGTALQVIDMGDGCYWVYWVYEISSHAGENAGVNILPVWADAAQNTYFCKPFLSESYGLGDTPFSNTATVSISVAPVAVDDAYSTTQETLLTVTAGSGVLANDSAGTGPTAALVTDVSHGTLALASDGSFTYLPDTDFYGTDTFTYQAFNGAVGSNIATVTITVVAASNNMRYLAVSSDGGTLYGISTSGVYTIHGSATDASMTIKTKSFGTGGVKQAYRLVLDLDGDTTATVSTNRDSTGVEASLSAATRQIVWAALPMSLTGEWWDMAFSGTGKVYGAWLDFYGENN